MTGRDICDERGVETKLTTFSNGCSSFLHDSSTIQIIAV